MFANPHAQSRVVPAFVQWFSNCLAVYAYSEGQSNFNTFYARKCGILKIKPHYLNMLLEEET